MTQIWTDDDQIFLIQQLPTYRSLINYKDKKETREITRAFAEHLHQQSPELQHRTVIAITQRLLYLDNLLAGIWADKD